MIQMRNNAWKYAIALAVAGMMALPGVASAATVDEVIAKYIEATGGREAQEAVKSMLQKGELNIVEFGMQADMTVYYKDGNYKLVMDIPGMGEVIQGVTGDVTWSMNPMEGNTILEGQAAESMRQQASLNPLLSWKETYASAEIVGEEGGATKVRFTSASGNETTIYFDNTSGLITKQEGAGPDGDATVRLSEYKKVGAITMPHKAAIETVQANMELTIATVELNAKIDDSIFELPAEISSLLPEEPAAGLTAEQLMAFMDANGDGKITMDEAPEQVKTGFAFIDQNGDGGIDLKEAQVMADYANSGQPQSPEIATGGVTAEQVMAMMDANGDGKITMDEAPEELQTWFTQVDQNADDGIDLTEAQFIADGMNNQ